MIDLPVINTSPYKLPDYATSSSAGLDLRANIKKPVYLNPFQRILIPTGLKISLPEKFEGQIRPRSGLALKHGITVLNSPKEKVAYNVYNVGDTRENYTKQMLINEIRKVLPNCRIKYVKKNDDPRDYRVNCDKIKKELGFKITKTVPDGILEIKRLIQENVIKDPENQKYYNIPHETK